MSHATLSRLFGSALTETDRAKSSPHFAQVSELAYQLWKDSGFAPGTELEYWYDAERQLFSAANSAAEPPARLRHVS